MCTLSEEGTALSQGTVALWQLPTSLPRTTTSDLIYRKGDKMTLQEAIEIGTQYTKGTDLMYLPKFPDALRLLIEAGKRIQECRLADHMIREDWLPGETKD